jgi:hypothetical protein
MSIWKSPVFYFGVLLTLLVTAALAAPYVVPWNNYRDSLENYGRKLTGRDVTIGGDIAVKLFPYPQLEARDVAIGNPDGFSNVAFVKAEAVRVRLSLGGLFNGSVDVETVDVAKPEINLQRNASGEVNWIFAPQEQVTGQGLLARVKLDQIVLSRGLLSFDDLRNGNSTVVTDLNATLSAQSVLGPWRMKGSSKWNDTAFDVSVITSVKEAAQPLKFTVKLTPHDLAFPGGALEGAWDGVAFKGALRIDPQESKGEKQSAESAFKPLAIQAQVEASEQRMSLLKIKIAPSDRKDSGTLIEGDAIVEFGTQSVARLDLKSPRINLDTLVGSAALSQWRDGGFLSVANQLLLNTPAKLVADYKLNISVLTSGGQALNDVRLTGSLQKEALRVQEFVAELPGRSVGVFDGILFPGEKSAQLGGKFQFETGDMRSFVTWLAPSWKDSLNTHWTGSRGRLAVQSGALNWSGQGLELADVRYNFEGANGTAALTLGLGEKKASDISVDIAQLDIDNFAPNGWSLVRDGGFSGLISTLVQPDKDNKDNLRLNLKSKLLLLNGVSAQNVALDFLTTDRGFKITQLALGNVNGAQLSGGGELVDKGEGAEGVLNFNLQAADPRGFLRLAGLEYGASNWTQALGQTVFDAKLTAVPQKTGPEIEIVARGTSGALKGELVATARNLEKGPAMNIAASGGLNSADSAALAKLVGVEPNGSVGPGDMTFEFNGSWADGFVVSSRLKALDAVAEFAGTADAQKPFYGLSGKMQVKANDGTAVLQASGVPLTHGISQALEFSSVLAMKDEKLSFIDMAGNIAGRRFTGVAQIAKDRQFEADIETDTVSLSEVLAMAFMPWEGVVQDSGTGFADLEGGLKGELYLRPLQFETITAEPAREVVVGIGFAPEERRLSIKTVDAQGPNAEITLKPRGSSYDIEGRGRWPVDVGQQFKNKKGETLLSGGLLLQGNFKSSGRSPAAALAALEGKGRFELSNAVLVRQTLAGFAPAVLEAKTPEALTQALSMLDSPSGTSLGAREGDFTVSSGEVVFSPFGLQQQGVDVQIAPTFDSVSRQIKTTTTVKLNQQPELPSVNIVYDGAAGAMDVRNGTSALAAKLGYALLSKEMAELERLQDEQQKLLAKEEQQRRDDELRFADYQNTRAELRAQARLRRFHAAERDKKAQAFQAILDDALKASAATSKQDLLRHGRRLAVRRGL